MNYTKPAFLLAALIIIGYYYFIKVFVSKDSGNFVVESRGVSYYGTNQKTIQQRCFRNYFQHILLVIVYNYPHYESIPILKEFYRPLFPNIYFCGPRDPNKNHSDVHQFDINRGIFGYECLANAIRENHFQRGFKGYFYINDDVILNFWNLLKPDGFEERFIWSYRNGRESLEGDIPTKWYWWVSPYGFTNVKSTVKNIEMMAGRFPLYEKLFRNYLTNGNGTRHGYNGRSDILYIPGHLALQFQELSRHFRKENVFLEIAIPTIIRFLSLEKDIRNLYGHYIPGDVRKNDTRVIDSRHFWVTYLNNPNLWFIHPFKLQHRYENNHELNVLLLKHILIKKSRELACL